MRLYHSVPIWEYRFDEEGRVKAFGTSGTYLYIDRVSGEVPVIPIVAGVDHFFLWFWHFNLFTLLIGLLEKFF